MVDIEDIEIKYNERPKNPSPQINMPRFIKDHVDDDIIRLENEIVELHNEIVEKEYELVKLRMYKRASDG